MKKRMSGEAGVLEHIEKTFRFPADRRLLLGPGVRPAFPAGDDLRKMFANRDLIAPSVSHTPLKFEA